MNDSGLGASHLWFECSPAALPRPPIFLPSSSPLQAFKGTVSEVQPFRYVPRPGKCTLLLNALSPGLQAPGPPPSPAGQAALLLANSCGSSLPPTLSLPPLAAFCSGLFINDLAEIFARALISFGHAGKIE